MTHLAAAKPAGQATAAHGRAGRLPRRLLATLAVTAGLLGAARAQDEVPFITTPDLVTLAMLQLAGVTANDFVIDLGSGDGRIVITAARRFGARGLGVEIDPDLVARSRDNARAAGVADRAEFREQDLFQTDLAAAQVITLYLLPEVNLQLRPRLLALAPGTRIVSHDWGMGDWLADRQLTLDVPDKAIGREKRSTVQLWLVPAAVQGLWCTAGASLAISQRFQAFSATLTATLTATLSATLSNQGAAAPLLVFDGRVVADHLHAGSASQAAPQLLRLLGDTLLWLRSSGPAQRFEGRRFERAGPQGCR